MITKDELIIFVKYPEKGKVKTRLAENVGKEKALEFYKGMLDYLSKEHQDREYSVKVAYTPKGGRYFAEKFGSVFLQEGRNLGERLENAFKREFKERKKKVIIIGSDIPGLNHEIVENAFRELGKFDVVIGPSGDGGYYLIGMKKTERIFSGIKWSTSSVFSETMKLIMENSLKAKILKKMDDVDHVLPPV